MARYGRANVHARRSDAPLTLTSRTAARSRGYIECGPTCMRRGYGWPADFYDAPVLRRRGLVLATAVVLAITGCSSGGGVRQGPSFDNTTPATGPNSTPATAVPTIQWGKTDHGVQHGTLEVAVDPDDPAAGTFTLALARHLATDPDERIGSLLVNPGGPGASGLFLAEQARPSTATSCCAGSTSSPSTRVAPVRAHRPSSAPTTRTTSSASTRRPTTRPRRRRWRTVRSPSSTAARNAAVTCSITSRTADAAGDMDTIRRALGEDTISYFGFSYGSELGATWATMFPTTVRAVVLDGAIDPTLGYLQMQLDQAAGFEATFDTFLDACNADPGCAFHNGGHADTAFDALAAQVEQSPIPTRRRTPTGEQRRAEHGRR